MENYTEHYRQLTDEELIRLADQQSSLVLDAQSALDSELRRRKLGDSELKKYWAEAAVLDEADRLRLDDVVTINGIGRRFYGKRNASRDAAADTEEFVATLWIIVLFIPIIPVGTYRIRRQSCRHWWNVPKQYSFQVLQKLPRDWGQIALTWVKFAVALLLLPVALALYFGLS